MHRYAPDTVRQALSHIPRKMLAALSFLDMLRMPLLDGGTIGAAFKDDFPWATDEQGQEDALARFRATAGSARDATLDGWTARLDMLWKWSSRHMEADTAARAYRDALAGMIARVDAAAEALVAAATRATTAVVEATRRVYKPLRATLHAVCAPTGDNVRQSAAKQRDVARNQLEERFIGTRANAEMHGWPWYWSTPEEWSADGCPSGTPPEVQAETDFEFMKIKAAAKMGWTNYQTLIET